MKYARSHCTRQVDETTKTVTYTGKCIMSGKEHSVTISLLSERYYNEGQLIQDAMPNISKEDREFLISGVSPEGWKQL